MLRIGICDDSADARVALRAALERALERRRSGWSCRVDGLA